jgi:hypothetical protein
MRETSRSVEHSEKGAKTRYSMSCWRDRRRCQGHVHKRVGRFCSCNSEIHLVSLVVSTSQSLSHFLAVTMYISEKRCLIIRSVCLGDLMPVERHAALHIFDEDEEPQRSSTDIGTVAGRVVWQLIKANARRLQNKITGGIRLNCYSFTMRFGK